MNKICSKCKRKLSLRNFYRDTQKKDCLSSSCKECHRKQQIISYEKRREKCLKYHKEHYQKNKEKNKEIQKKHRVKIFTEIFNLLGNQCVMCGIKDRRVLQIDHIKGGGYRHRKIKGYGMGYYKDILKSIKNKENKYQLLCANCNFIEGIKKGYRKTTWS